MVRDIHSENQQLLIAIAQELGNVDVGETHVEQNIGRQQEESSVYFSSGPTAVEVEATGSDYKEFKFGFKAQTINIRTDDDIYIAFRDPSNDPSAMIPVNADEGRFTIGGYNGINTENMYVRLQPEAGEVAEVKVVAYK